MNYTILIVDDEPLNIESIINGLLQRNYNVLIATNGTDGCRIATEKSPDLIIMDWEMPDMNGIEAIRILKQNELTARIPVIMATGVMLTSKHLKTALEAGAVDYIRKPIDEVELLARTHSTILLFEQMKRNIELETQMAIRENEDAQREIEANKQALANLTMRIIQNTEQNSRLFDELTEVSLICNDKGKKAISRLISNFRVDSKNVNWEEFDILFEQVHCNFYEKLNNQFTDLTANERKLCVFYKLNLNSKEISSLTLQNENALKKARARLRKKLNLPTEQSIHLFLQQFL
ncbi:MAG: hypothetical protein AUK44_02080 [Porphyromonadaceae bacterium CG2_30_38_12]|nr:MAG: hypothetical protein AUK44_02080 [Porphyromonadaceae bacterium CG2_30_38_12]